MKLTQNQFESLVTKVFDAWKKNNVVTFKEDEKKVFQRAIEVLKADLQKEIDLEKEVHKMLDDLERTNQGQFQRHKMYPMLKQKLAQQKKVIL